MKFVEFRGRIIDMKNYFRAIYCTLVGVAILGMAPVAYSGSVSAPVVNEVADEKENAGTAPVYEGAKEYSGTAGQAISITLTASGTKPMIFEAENLPPDLTLDLKSGVISGKVSQAGDYTFSVVITNKAGEARVQITLKVK